MKKKIKKILAYLSYLDIKIFGYKGIEKTNPENIIACNIFGHQIFYYYPKEKYHKIKKDID